MPININLDPQNSEYHRILIKTYGYKEALRQIRLHRIIWDQRTTQAVKNYKSRSLVRRETVT